MKYSEDYGYIINKEWLKLWEKYKPLQMSYFVKLSSYIRRSLYEYGFDEFRQDAFIVMMNAVNGLKLEKIPNKDTYSFYIQYSQWLHNFTTRSIVRDFCHNYTVSYDDTPEDKDGNKIEDKLVLSEDRHSNLEELIERFSLKDQDIAFKIMYHMPRGGKGLSDSAKEIVKKYFTEY